MGYQTGAILSLKDTLYLGRLADMQDRPKVAFKWLAEASLQAAMDQYNTVEQSQVNLMVLIIELNYFAILYINHFVIVPFLY